MAAPTINQIREALATRLGNIPDTQISAYALSNPTPPTLQVVSGEIPYDETFGSSASMTYQFKVQALAGAVTDIGAQKLLGAYADTAGTKSVHATIGADKTLGGVVLMAQVENATPEQVYEINGNAVIGREWIVEILASGA